MLNKGFNMKYWNELTGVEDSLIELEVLLGAMRTISGGIESSNIEDIQNAFYLIEKNLESISKNASENFQYLWEVIRNDTFNLSSDLSATEETLEDLTNVVNAWVGAT